jgi:hypothetical protein
MEKKADPIHINPAHKGEFTRKAKAHGETVAQYADEVTAPGSKADASTKKQGQFAKNARGFKH